MTANVLHIVEKVSPHLLAPALPRNFVVREGESVPPQMVVDHPNISLYCLDDENKRALFVETPPSVDLSQAPFAYMTQYLEAQRLIAVSYDSLHQLADDLSAVDQNLIFIYSVGRCGSTLISQSLNEVEGVVSYSEPDVHTQITMMRYADASRDDEYTALLKSCTRVFAKRNPIVALKFRSNVTHVADLLHRAFPAARNLFLYRNAETWAQSVNSAFGADAGDAMQDPVMIQFFGSHATLAEAYAQRHGRAPIFNEFLALFWLSILDKVVRLHDQGVPYLAVCYEDIKTQPKRVLTEIFEYCGLNPTEVDAAYQAFSRDSQEGTMISQARRQQNPVAPLGEAEYAQIRTVLREHPMIQSPEFSVPGTLSLSAVLGG